MAAVKMWRWSKEHGVFRVEKCNSRSKSLLTSIECQTAKTISVWIRIWRARRSVLEEESSGRPRCPT